MGVLKVIRNNKYLYALDFPLWYTAGCIIQADFSNNMTAIALTYGVVITEDYLKCKYFKKMNSSNIDQYALKSSSKLKKLPSQLKDINVRTDYDMLLKSFIYDKKYKIEFNENKLLSLKKKKYVLVPSYSFDGSEKETSILQEHNIGTCDYILSVGEPDKQYRRVLVKSFS